MKNIKYDLGDTFKDNRNTVLVIMDIADTGITFLLNNTRVGLSYTATVRNFKDFDKFLVENKYKKI